MLKVSWLEGGASCTLKLTVSFVQANGVDNAFLESLSWDRVHCSGKGSSQQPFLGQL